MYISGYFHPQGVLKRLECYQVLENALLNIAQAAVGEKEERIRELEKENRRLQAQLNMRSFSNDPERDKKIILLRRRGASYGKIAKEVGLSKPGVFKALKRLGVNSVNVENGNAEK